MKSLLSITFLFALLMVSSAFGVPEVAAEPVPWLEAISKLLGNIPMYLTLAVGLFTSVLAIALVIPGDQPDKFLKSVLDILIKFSKK